MTDVRQTMKSNAELISRNAELLKSTVNRQGMYGLIIALLSITIASLLVSYQVTGEISLNSFLYIHEHNLAVRLLEFLPFVFTFWGQKAGYNIASRAGEIIMDETDELRAETTSWKIKSLHESTHDALTGLPNRVLFYELLRRIITTARLNKKPVVIIFMDLDGFKDVNDTFGNNVGDQILQLLSARMKRLVASGDTLARLGGDEFALILETTGQEEGGIEVARRIQQMLSTPFIVEGRNIGISASIGISYFPRHADDEDSLLQCAEIATHAAKRTIEGYMIYSAELKQANPRRFTLTSDLRRAIENELLEFHFQPKVDLTTGQTPGAEALLRWNHPEHGSIPPEEFTRLAERTRLITALSRLVIKKSIRQLQVWRTSGIELNLSLNITAHDLNDDKLPGHVAAMLADSGVDPVRLTFEITESSVMENAEQALQIIKQLADLKLRLSIDDFGTGYSSLAYLSKLPVHELKIDKTFVLGMAKNRSDYLIVKATIDLGHNLGLKVTAEGIEDQQAWDTLQQLGCDLGQGFFMSRPLPEHEFEEWLVESRRNLVQ